MMLAIVMPSIFLEMLLVRISGRAVFVIQRFSVGFIYDRWRYMDQC